MRNYFSPAKPQLNVAYLHLLPVKYYAEGLNNDNRVMFMKTQGVNMKTDKKREFSKTQNLYNLKKLSVQAEILGFLRKRVWVNTEHGTLSHTGKQNSLPRSSLAI